MSNPNIILTRVDNRLVHGQVGVTWIKSLGVNLLIVADDQTANDPLQQQLMSLAAESSGVSMRYFTIEHTASIIHNAAAHQKIFIVCRTPEDVKRLVDQGTPIENINLGNMHHSPGKDKISKKVYMDNKDKDHINYLLSKGINIYIQDVPGDTKKQLDMDMGEMK